MMMLNAALSSVVFMCEEQSLGICERERSSGKRRLLDAIGMMAHELPFSMLRACVAIITVSAILDTPITRLHLLAYAFAIVASLIGSLLGN